MNDVGMAEVFCSFKAGLYTSTGRYAVIAMVTEKQKVFNWKLMLENYSTDVGDGIQETADGRGSDEEQERLA